MKKLLFILVLVISTNTVLAWGKTGHRTVGEVAQKNLTKKAQKNLHKLLDGYSLAEVSNWMDNIKSNPEYDSLKPRHYVSIPDGMTYEETETNPEGDLIKAIEFLIDELKKGELDHSHEVEYIKMLVHLAGDLHQPLHVGRASDRGGNDIKVKFFDEPSNLHKVWDSDMIQYKEYSYTELSQLVSRYKNDLEFKNVSVRERAHEAMEYRNQIYDLPQNKEIGYHYCYKNWDLMKKQLYKGGIFLATTLNEIYG